jgi:IS30 family transposase
LAQKRNKTVVAPGIKSKTKKNLARTIKKTIKPFKHLCHTITFDNGGEFSGHQQIAKYLEKRRPLAHTSPRG